MEAILGSSKAKMKVMQLWCTHTKTLTAFLSSIAEASAWSLGLLFYVGLLACSGCDFCAPWVYLPDIVPVQDGILL